jgi:hypothetical protein
MNDLEQEKLKRFVSDQVMSEAVFKVLMRSFTRSKPNAQVNELAASFLAIGLLKDSWNELENFKRREDEEREVSRQVGL